MSLFILESFFLSDIVNLQHVMLLQYSESFILFHMNSQSTFGNEYEQILINLNNEQGKTGVTRLGTELFVHVMKKGLSTIIQIYSVYEDTVEKKKCIINAVYKMKKCNICNEKNTSFCTGLCRTDIPYCAPSPQASP